MKSLNTQALGIPRVTVRRTMTQVMIALVPGTLLYAAIIDSRVILHVVIACSIAISSEAVCLFLRQRPIRPALGDGSVILASWLLVLCLPPSLPVWQLLIGVILMVTLGKHVFGGLGHNPFNPAMVAYAVLLVSFPVTMTHWELGEHALLTIDSVSHSDNNDAATTSDSKYKHDHAFASWDGMTGATVLDRLRDVKLTTANSATTLPDHSNLQASRYSASSVILHTPWVWVNLAWLAGGLYLLWLGIISWHTPVSVLLSITTLYAIAGLLSSSSTLQVLPALLSGAIMLAAFFIATDPVSGAASRQGQLVFGTGIGVVAFVIREYSVYPEGIAFAVLLMNMCVPLIDRLSTGSGGRLTLRKPAP